MKGETQLVFILDKSGSMCGLESDTIGGFNSMLKKQKELPDPCRITTVLFDTSYTTVHDHQDIQRVPYMTEADFRVGGCTALLDALGDSIRDMVSLQRHLPDYLRAEKVVFVIITDGHENASRRYSSRDIRQMIEKEQNEYGWEFIFLGANIDAVETARRYGIREDRAADYTPDEQGTALNFSAVSSSICSFRQNGVMEESCLDEVRSYAKKQAGKKPGRNRKTR